MPVFDHSYRHLDKPLVAPAYRFLVIARMGIVEHLRRRWFDLLLVVAGIPFVYYAVRLFVEMRFPEVVQNVPQIAVGPTAFLEYVKGQIVFAFLVTIFAGSGLISNDLRTRALPLYLSRPISRFDYALGKFLVASFFVAVVTIVPAELLLFLRIMTSENLKFFTDHPLLPLQVLAASLLIISAMSILMLAMSSLSRSAWLPGLGFAILYLFGRAQAAVMQLVFKSFFPVLMSLRHNLARCADAIFGAPPQVGPSWIASFVVLAFACGLSVIVLMSRIRAVEVVSS